MKNLIQQIKNLLTISFCFLSALCFSQNVGIGNNSPDARLNVNTGRSIPGIMITDSTIHRGGSLLFKNDQDTVAFEFTTYTSDNPANNFLDIRRQDQPVSEAILTMRGNGSVGINKIQPQSRLDIGGNMNLSGNIKVDNVQGTPGQALITKSDGSTGWGSVGSSDYENAIPFFSDDSWTVPAGVTEIAVELWGGGAAGNHFRGGNSGNYVFAILPVTPGELVNIDIGSGGEYVWSGGVDPQGEDTEITIGGNSIYAKGGRLPFLNGHQQQNSTAFGSTSFPKYIQVKEGHTGTVSILSYEPLPNISNTAVIKTERAGNGGAVVNRGNSADGGTKISVVGASTYSFMNRQRWGSNAPRSGGGQGNPNGNDSDFPTGLNNGGRGFANIYW